jgi:protoheme IX farnesyltransferase
MLPTVFGLDSAWYAGAAAAIGALFLWRAAGFLGKSNRDAGARRLFLFSLAYLPILLGLLVADRLIGHFP